MNKTYDAVPLFPSNLFVSDVKDELCSLIEPEKYNYIDNESFPEFYTEDNSYREEIGHVAKSYATINHRILEFYPEVKKEIEARFNQITEDFFRYEEEFRITTSWITKTLPGGFSERHFHKNCYYAGVLYFDDYEEDGGDLGFFSPLDHLGSFFIHPVVNDNEYTAGSSWYRPKHGQVIFFPAYLQHRVGLHRGKKPRYSLAFNFVPTGQYGCVDSTYDTKWFV